jgi:ATP-dependent HslUV protease ATP-binding subunit HslU
VPNSRSIPIEDLTPQQIVRELEQYIVGQDRAKRAVAIAMRNRFRRAKLPPEQRDDIIPKNILMMGPTGVGKTEIARRLARLARAPFVKVEATKFTEVGYVGRDVDSIVRDLTNVAVRIVEAEKSEEVREAAYQNAVERVVDIITGKDGRERRGPTAPWLRQAMELFGAKSAEETDEDEKATEDPDERARQERRLRARERIVQQVREGVRDDEVVEIEVEESTTPFIQVFSPQGVEEMGVDVAAPFSSSLGKGRSSQKLPIGDALKVLTEEEARKMIDQGSVAREAVARVEQTGIVFLDELDKVTGGGGGVGPDVSREGVQRDLLPLIEGTTVVTKYGPVRTDFILFIAAGAFHTVKPSDLIPELQGRLPIRVELDALSRDDFHRILTEPKNSLITQYQQLLGTEGVTLTFEPEAVAEIAAIASDINARMENIGARRLHTVMERVLEDSLYEAPDVEPPHVTVTAEFVKERLSDLASDTDQARYIL